MQELTETLQTTQRQVAQLQKEKFELQSLLYNLYKSHEQANAQVLQVSIAIAVMFCSCCLSDTCPGLVELFMRTFIKERQINNRFIDLLNKHRIIVLSMYMFFFQKVYKTYNSSNFIGKIFRKINFYEINV